MILAVVVGLAPTGPPIAAADSESQVPPRVLDELAETMKPPPGREGHSDKVRRYTRAIREARAYATEFGDASNCYEVQNILLAALQARMNLEADAETYKALLETAGRIMASEAPRRAKLEADLVRVRERVRTEQLKDAALRQVIVDFAGRYQGSGVGEKALIYASMLAEAEGNRALINVLRIELARRRAYWDRPGVTGFLRRSTDLGLAGRTFNATLKRLDGTMLHAPRDLLGKVTVILFWASDHQRSTDGIDALKGFYEKHKDMIEIVGVSLDDARADVVRYVKRNELPWVQTFSGRGRNDPTAWTYGVDGIPSALMVGPNGKLRHLKGLVGWYGNKPDTSFGSYGGLVGNIEEELRWYETLGDAVQRYLSGECLAFMSTGPFTEGVWSSAGLPGETMSTLRGRVEAMRTSPAGEAKVEHANAVLEAVQSLERAHPGAAGLTSARNAGIVAAQTLWIETREEAHRQTAYRLAEAVMEDGAGEVGAAARRVLADYVLTDRRLVESSMDVAGQIEAIDSFAARYARTEARTPAAILAGVLAVAAGNDAAMNRTANALAADHADSPQARSYLRYTMARYIDRGELLEAEFERTDGERLVLPGDLEDKVTVVCFWDAESMRRFRRIPDHPRRYHPEYAGLKAGEHEDQVVIGVNLDASPEAAQAMIDNEMPGWIHTRPNKGWGDALVRKLDIQQLPSIWIVGRDGRITADDVLSARVRSGVFAASVHQPPPDTIGARTVNQWRMLGPFHQRDGQKYTETGYVSAPDWIQTEAAQQAWLDMPWQRSRWFGDQLEERFSRTAYPPARAETNLDFDASYDNGRGEEIGWRTVRGDDYGMFDLARLYPDAPKPAIVYGVTYVHSVTGGSYRLAVSHNNAITLRVNGEQVLRKTGQDHVEPPSFVWPAMADPPEGRLLGEEHSPMPMDRAFLDRDWLEVDLRKGWNELFIRTVDVRGTWRFGLRIADPQRTLRYALSPGETAGAQAGRLPRWREPMAGDHVRRLVERVDGGSAEAILWAARSTGEFGHAWRAVSEHLQPYLDTPALDALTLLGAMHALDLWEPGESLRKQYAGANRTTLTLEALAPDALVERMSEALEQRDARLANLDQVREREREHVREDLQQRKAYAVRAIGALARPEARQWLIERFEERSGGGASQVPLNACIEAAGDQRDPVFIEHLRPHLNQGGRGFRRSVIDAMLAIGIGQAADAEQVEAELIEAIENAEWRGFITTQKIARVGGPRARQRIIESVQNHFQHGMPSHEASERHVENLAHFEHPDVVPEVARFLDHDDQRIRTMAIRTLGELGHDSATPPLLEALADPSNGELRPYIVRALGRIGDARAEAALAKMMGAQAYHLRIGAARALASVGRGEAATEALVGALDDSHWLVRVTAADSLVALQAEAAVESLVATLADGQGDVRAAAAQALGKLGASSATDPLINALADWEAGPSAAAALRELGWAPGDHAKVQVRDRVARRDVEALAKDWSAAHAVLVADLASDDAVVARNAAYALIASGDGASIDEVAAYLERSANPAVAVAMLNASTPAWGRAAERWAGEHGYTIERQRMAPPAADRRTQ